MIPIVAITNAISFLVCLFAFLKLNRSYRASRKENEFVGYFAMFYLFMTMFFFLLSMPGVVFGADIFTVSAVTIASVVIYMASLFFIMIPLRIWNINLAKKVIIVLILSLLLITLFLNIIDIGKPVYKFIGNFYYVVVVQNTFARTLVGITTGLTSILGSLFFIINGLGVNLDTRVKIRSFIIGGGMMFLIAASIVNYIVVNLTSSVYTIVLASVLAVLGLVIMFAGILVGKNKY